MFFSQGHRVSDSFFSDAFCLGGDLHILSFFSLLWGPVMLLSSSCFLGNLVDLVKSFQTNIFLQKLASIQKRASPAKFAHLAEKSENGSVSNLSTKDYFDALSSGAWADASSPLALSAVPGAALEACLEWIYTGTCTAADDPALADVLAARALGQN